MISKIDFVLNVASLVTAVLAAWWWYKSAQIPMPKLLSLKSTQPFKSAGLIRMEAPLDKSDPDYLKKLLERAEKERATVGDTWIGSEFSNEMSNLIWGLQIQSRQSAKAAIFAAIAALDQAIIFIIHLIH